MYMLLYYLSGLIFMIFSIFLMLLSLLIMIFKKSFFFEWNILEINSFMINMFIYIDWMSLLFMFTVLLISSMIMFYSSEYMNNDLNFNRFFYLVFFFIMSMLLMILSPNLISILIGWDGLGLISYCLVIYYQSYSSFNSGMLTILMNRIGDVLILISIGLMMTFGTWNIMNLNNCMNLILILIILASFTKSAQFPFSSWLPAAMAAPTPVSSLVHSSTLVTAGVYLLIRFHYVIFKNDILMKYIVIIGLLTMLFAGLSANLEFDLKKIIAFSTLSQLGLMMMIFGMKNFELTFFHLIIHAMFKSMMFMCSGIFIHSSLNYQDIRFMGMLKNFMPLTCSIFFMSTLSLSGMPFFSGFYSKDQILEFMIMNKMNFILFFLLILSTGLTISYNVRLISYLMKSKNFNFFPMMNLLDNKMMNFSMMILLVMTVVFGNFMNWIMFSMIEEIYLMFMEKIIVFITCLLFIILSKYEILNYNYFLKYFLGNMWFLYKFNYLIMKYPLIKGLFIQKILDKGWSEWLVKKSIINISFKMNLMNNIQLNYFINLLLMMSYIVILMILLN